MDVYKNYFYNYFSCLRFFSFSPLLYNIFKKVAKPHFFSWITWGILTGLGFILSLKGGGGEGLDLWIAVNIMFRHCGIFS